MAVVNQTLEYEIQRGLDIIDNLPEEDKYFVQVYVKNIKEVLERTKEDNKRMRDIFKTIAYYGK
jgi:hypothetical protein